MRRWRVWLILGGLTVVLGGGGYYSWYKKKHGPPKVSVAKVERQDIVAKVTANGKIQAENKVDLSALVHGPDRQPGGARGRPGQDGRLPPPDRPEPGRGRGGRLGRGAAARACAELDSARATLDQAERDFERAQKNYEARHRLRGRLPARPVRRSTRRRAAYQAAENRVEQIRASLNASRDTLSKTTVRAPIDGIVTALRVKAGEVTVLGTMNNPGTQLMTISDMSTRAGRADGRRDRHARTSRSARRRC